VLRVQLLTHGGAIRNLLRGGRTLSRPVSIVSRLRWSSVRSSAATPTRNSLCASDVLKFTVSMIHHQRMVSVSKERWKTSRQKLLHAEVARLKDLRLVPGIAGRGLHPDPRAHHAAISPQAARGADCAHVPGAVTAGRARRRLRRHDWCLGGGACARYPRGRAGTDWRAEAFP
jgi:hypothetical protein